MLTLEQWADQFSIRRKDTRRLWMAIRAEFARQDLPMTVRQMFYRMSAQGEIEKTEAGYRRLQGALTKMRRAGAAEYGWIADGTRWVRRPKTYRGLAAMREEVIRLYRRDLWANQPAYVEIWLEKDALAGVLYPITEEYDVPLYVVRGFSSLTYLYEAAEMIRDVNAENKPVFIYHFGDFDASGKDVGRNVQKRLREFGAEFEFIEAAVTEAQIEALGLPTRLAKKTDPRARRWTKSYAVDLDAMEPVLLRSLARNCIERHINQGELYRIQQIETLEREALSEAWPESGTSTTFLHALRIARAMEQRKKKNE